MFIKQPSLYHKGKKDVRKITVFVPCDKNQKWRYKIGSGGLRSRKNVNTLMNALQGAFSRLDGKEKLVVIVKYDKDTFNETIRSSNANYWLYATSCFLEDYLTKDMLLKYGKVTNWQAPTP